MKYKGFTLIELLIVMAIIGVLAVIVFVAINPVQRLAQTRDTGRISAVAQLGRSLQAYYTNKAEYPPQLTWADDLLAIGEISTFPSGINYSVSGTTFCAQFVQPGDDPTYCYAVDTDYGAIVYARAESLVHTSKCTLPDLTYFVFSTADARGGTICSSTEPTPWASGTQTYVD